MLFTPLFLAALTIYKAGSQTLYDASQLISPLSITWESTMDVESADLDGDGDLDVVLAMEFKKNILLFNDNGELKYDPSKSLPTTFVYGNPAITGEDSEDILIRDFDQDGDLDILFGTEDTGFHEYLLNDGTGSFSLAPFQFPKILNCNALASLDLNGDSLLDVVLGTSGVNEVYINQGSGSFELDTTGLMELVNVSTQDLRVIDLDGDGDLDVVEGADIGQSNLYIKDSAGWRVDNSRLPAFGNIETRKVIPFDFDQDSDIDLFFCNVGWTPGTNPQNLLLINDGTGFFVDESTTRIPLLNETTLDAILVDLNGDGVEDMITSGFGSVQNYRAFLNNSADPGHFSEDATLIPPLTNKNGIALHSFEADLDTIPDIYIGNFQSSDFYLRSQVSSGIANSTLSSPISVFPNPSNGVFTISWNSNISLISLFDMHGRKWNIEVPTHITSKVISVDYPGIYTVVTIDNQGNRLEKKIVSY